MTTFDNLTSIALVWLLGFGGQWGILYVFINNSFPVGTEIDRRGVNKACAMAGVALVLFWKSSTQSSTL